MAHIFAEHGWGDAKRSGDAGQPDGDIDHVEPFYAEVRRREQLALPAWIKEVEAECPDNLTPIIVYRRSRMAWQVSLALHSFLSHVRPPDTPRN